MARKPPGEYEHPGLDLDYAPFDEAGLGRILEIALPEVTPDPAVIAAACERLNAAAVFLRLNQDLSQGPTDDASAKLLGRIGSRAAALQKLLPLTDSDGLGGAGSNPRVVDGVARLLTPAMSELMTERLRRESDGKGNGLTASELYGGAFAGEALVTLYELLGLVAAAAEASLAGYVAPHRVRGASPTKAFAYAAAQEYHKLTGRDPLASSWNVWDKEVGGPLIRFLAACCQQVVDEVPPATIDDWIQSWREEAKMRTPPP